MTEQQTPEIAVIAFTNNFFFKCPMGGYASIRPGFCPKCDEPLVLVAPIDSRSDEQLGGTSSYNDERRFADK